MSMLKRPLFAAMALAGWFALIAQFWLNSQAGLSPAETIIRYFSYFTLLTNIGVALYSTLHSLFPQARTRSLFYRASTQCALTVYILIVGIVYNILLRNLWNPQGLQKTIDILLHTAIPLLFFAMWLMYGQKKQLQWNHSVKWLAYPLVYCIWILARGYLSDFYPYPFMDVDKIGLTAVLLNTTAMAVAFMFLSLLLIAFGKKYN